MTDPHAGASPEARQPAHGRVRCPSCGCEVSARPDTNFIRLYWRCGNLNCARYLQDARPEMLASDFFAQRAPVSARIPLSEAEPKAVPLTPGSGPEARDSSLLDALELAATNYSHDWHAYNSGRGSADVMEKSRDQWTQARATIAERFASLRAAREATVEQLKIVAATDKKLVDELQSALSEATRREDALVSHILSCDACGQGALCDAGRVIQSTARSSSLVPEQAPARPADASDYQLLVNAVEQSLASCIVEDDVAAVAIYADAIETAGTAISEADDVLHTIRAQLSRDLARKHNSILSTLCTLIDGLWEASVPFGRLHELRRAAPSPEGTPNG